MAESPQFALWLRVETGRAVVAESQLEIPAEHLRIEVRRGGQWTEVSQTDLSTSSSPHLT